MSIHALQRIKRAELCQNDRIRIAGSLQISILDILARVIKEGGMIFHGGTSIAFTKGSPRWSEDLDFMATPEAVSVIFSKIDAIQGMLQLKASLGTPGSTVTASIKKGGEGALNEVAKINVRWEHPEWVGAIRIKTEFFTCTPEKLDAYRSEPAVATWSGMEIRSEIQTATLESVWADKIVALALRPALKFRDIHDLGFLTPRLPHDFDKEHFLRSSMDIYGRAPQDVHDGLQRPVVLDKLHDMSAFSADMERWFPSQVFLKMKESGYLSTLHEGFLQQYDTAITSIARMTNEEDLRP